MAIWNITGTDQQQAIVREALAKIKFPFERLALPGIPELGWRDLNSGYYHALIDSPQHELVGDTPEPLLGNLEAVRNYILGVFYPGSARIYLDNALIAYPEIAQAVVSAEMAHAVDEFLPLSDVQRDAIMATLHGGGHDEHSWWEKANYWAEYYSLIGESFMILFTKAYSDIPFGNAEDFGHSGANVTAEQIRAIMGIQRTDLVTGPFVNYGKSKIYHRPTHYKKMGWLVVDTTGFRPCKQCKPGV